MHVLMYILYTPLFFHQVSEMYETTLSALKDEGNERMWFNTYVKLAKV